MSWSPEADKTSPRARPTKTFVKHESRSAPGSLRTGSGGGERTVPGPRKHYNVLMKMRPLETRYKIQDLQDFETSILRKYKDSTLTLAAWWPRGAGGYININIINIIAFVFLHIFV